MNKRDNLLRRKKRTSAKLNGTIERPRLSVYRSNKHVFVQLIDDKKGITIFGLSEKSLEKLSGTKTEKSKSLGLEIAKKAKAKKISKIIFDRGGHAYHGRLKSIAEGLREGGLEF